MSWVAGMRVIWGVGGSITAVEENGRRYHHVRVQFPKASGWWDRTTEVASVDEGKAWIERQENDYRAHFLSTPEEAPREQTGAGK